MVPTSPVTPAGASARRSACMTMPSALGSVTQSMPSMNMPRYQSLTALGCTPAMSAKLPVTISRWMWWPKPVSSTCPMQAFRQAMSVSPVQ